MLLPLLAIVTLSSGCHAKEMRSFEESMKLYKPQLINKIKSDPDWKFAQKIFDQCIQNNIDSNKQIPKIFHFIWLGGKPLTSDMQTYIASWQQYHPDWQCIVWRDADIEKFGLQNKQLYDQSTNMGKRSDIARYEILYRFGGVYIDIDFECFAPITHFCNCATFIASLDDGSKNIYCFNGFIGTIPQHPILKNCVEKLSHTKPGQETVGRILQETGPVLFTKAVKEHWTVEPNILLLPSCYVIGIPRYMASLAREQKLKFLTSITVAMHHWHGSWIPN